MVNWLKVCDSGWSIPPHLQLFKIYLVEIEVCVSRDTHGGS
jgi:hypothetical protein